MIEFLFWVPTLRSKSSVWATLAVAGVDKNGKVVCAIFGFKIAISRTSPSNIAVHYQTGHKQDATGISRGTSLTEKQAVMERAVFRFAARSR